MATTERTESIHYGAFPLSLNVLNNSGIGIWALEIDGERLPRLYGVDGLLRLIGVAGDVSPEESFRLWYGHIDPDNYEAIIEAWGKMSAGIHAEVLYPWEDESGNTRIIRYSGVSNPANTDGIRVEGIYQDVTELVHFEKEKQLMQQVEEAEKLIEGFANAYSVAFEVDTVADSFSILSIKEDAPVFDREYTSFQQLKEYFISNVVFEGDRDRIEKAIRGETVREKLAENSACTEELRIVKGGAVLWYEMTVKALDKNWLAIGFSNKNQEILLRRLQEKTVENYYALFSFDLDTEMFTVLKKTQWYQSGEVGESEPYAAMMTAFANNLGGEERDFFLRLANLETVRRDFAVEDKKTFSYRANFVEGNRWITVTFYVIVRHEDGSPAVITMGFSLNDSMESDRQELQEQLRENMEVISGLTSDYVSLYHVNLDNNSFKLYTLDDDRASDTRQLLTQDIDAFEMLHSFVRSPAVHPDDRALFAGITREGVKERLRGKKRFSVPFRRKFGEHYLWSVMDVVKYEPADEEANVIALGFLENDGEIRSEKTLANSLALLGREMSPDDVIDELLALLGDFYGASRAFVFECEEDGERIHSSYLWNSAGTADYPDVYGGGFLAVTQRWSERVTQQGMLYLDVEDDAISEEDRAVLTEKGLSSFLSVPLLRGAEFAGFIGVDSPTRAVENVGVLKTIATVAYSEILRRKESDEEHITLGKLTETFISVYYVDLTTNYIRPWKLAEPYRDIYREIDRYTASIDNYIQNNVAERERAQCMERTRPDYILEQFKTTNRFSVEMTDIMTGRERRYLFDFLKVNEEGTQLVFCCTDVTESIAREKAQQAELQRALRAAEEANRTVKNQSTLLNYFVESYAAAYFVDMKENTVKVLHLDERRRELFAVGRNRKDMERFISEHIHPEDRAKMREIVSPDYIPRRLKTEQDFTFTVREVFGDATQTMRCVVIRGLDEYHVAVGFLDITEELRREVEQYALIDGLAREYHTVWLMDGFGDHHVHLYRSTGEKTIQSTVQLGLDKPCYDTSVIEYINAVVHEEDRARVIEETKYETIERETPDVGTYVVSYRRYNLDHTGYNYHQICFAKAVASDGGVNYIMAFRDADKVIREQIAQQKRLQEALAMAQTANTAKTRFLFNMSHDIRTPLNAIIGFSNMAKRDIAAPEKALASLDKVRNASDMLLAMISDILDMSRIESGKAEVKNSRLDLAALFKKLASVMKEAEDAGGISLSFQMETLRHRLVYADTGYLERILLNIISNAVKYTMEGGTVTVTLEELESEKAGMGLYRFVVADTGIGMSEEFQEKMFDEFAREESTTVSGIPGTGLGLPLARRLVQLMDGEISCVSRKGEGSVFTILLPFEILPEETPEEQEETVNEGEPVRLAGKRVLLAEDNELNREIAEDILNEEGILVETAENGKEALDLVAERGTDYYDAILMDIQMPVMNGYEATRHIRRLPGGESVPVIAVSANAFKEDVEKSLEAGMDAHIAKPIDVKALLEVMNRLAR